MIDSNILEHVTEDDRMLVRVIDRCLDDVCHALNERPEIDRSRFRCHSTCRAVAMRLRNCGVRVVDGNYLGISIDANRKSKLETCPHTWLMTSSGAIIDPCPPGTMALTPLLLTTKGDMAVFTCWHYHETGKLPENRNPRDIWCLSLEQYRLMLLGRRAPE